MWQWRRRAPATPTDAALDAVPEDVLGLRQEVAALRAEVRQALRHTSVVRYDAFGAGGEVAGGVSWSMALLDDSGDGVVVTAIHGRTSARTYVKAVTAGAATSADHGLSPEETEAVERARGRVG